MASRITRLSPSAVETFDPHTPFGCHRKGYFQYVLGIRASQDPSAELGEQVHKTIEHYLRTGINGLHPIALAGKHFIAPYTNGRRITIEHKFGPDAPGVPLTAHGVPFAGRIDLLAERIPGDDPHHEILDWKTTSNIERYAKTVQQARESTQMMTYAEWFYRQVPNFNDPIRGTFVYFQTRGNRAERVTTVVDREFVANRWTVISDMVKVILDVAAEPSIEKVEPNLRACDIARGCPYRAQCPRADPLGIFDVNPQKSNPQGIVMSLLDRFRAPPPPPAPVAPVQQPPPAAAQQPRTLLIADAHPTAPEANPGVAQTAPAPMPVAPPAHTVAAVEKFEPVPPPKRGPGRPKKDAAKATDFTTPTPVPQQFATPAPQQAPAVLKRTLTHGLTINLGNYQFAKVEVALEATGLSVEELGRMVRDELEREARVYLGPAGTVVIAEAKK